MLQHQVKLLNGQDRAISHILQILVMESAADAELLVEVVVQIVVQSVHRLVLSVRLPNEHISIEIEQEDRVLIQQILVMVVHAVFQHHHIIPRDLVRMIEIVIQILDRVRHVHRALPHRPAFLPLSLDPQARRQHHPSTRQELVLERSHPDRAGRLDPPSSHQRALLELSALHQRAALIPRALTVEHAVVPLALIDHLLQRGVDQRAHAVRNALAEIAVVEQCRRHADEVPREKRLGVGETRSDAFGVERKAVRAATELLFGADLVVGEREREVEVGERRGMVSHFDSTR